MIDKGKIEQAVTLLLEGMGEDIGREGLKETPGRIARMYEEIFAGIGQTPEEYLSKTFSVEESSMVLEKDIVFYSTCEPFASFLWKSPYCVPASRESRGAEQTGKGGRSVCQAPTASRAAYSANCGCIDGVFAAERGVGPGGGRAYVHDDARREKARHPDCDACHQRGFFRR